MRALLVGALILGAMSGCGDEDEGVAEVCRDGGELGSDCIEDRTVQSCCNSGGTTCRFVFSDGTEFKCEEVTNECTNWSAQAAVQYCREGTMLERD